MSTYDPTTPRELGYFMSVASATTTSQAFGVPFSAKAIRVTWRLEQQDFGPNPPTNITVMDIDGNVIWGNLDIGLGNLTNVKSSDFLFPILPYISPLIQVVVTEGIGTTHKVYVTAMTESPYAMGLVSGSTITQSQRLSQIGNLGNPALTSFGELAVGGWGYQDNRSIEAVSPTDAVITLPADPGFAWHISSITVSLNKQPSAAMKVTATDTFGPLWKAYCNGTGGNMGTSSQWTFPDGGMSFTPGAAVVITVAHDGSNTGVILSTTSSARGY